MRRTREAKKKNGTAKPTYCLNVQTGYGTRNNVVNAYLFLLFAAL